MRRSRSALTAWPAFADLMTVLAVLGLAIAAGVASVDSDEELSHVRTLEAQLATARERNTRDGDRIRILEAQLAAERERNAALEVGIDEAERREIERRLGSVPCLGTRGGSRTAPVPLLRIVIDAGAISSGPGRPRYRLTPLWPPENAADVRAIPQLEEAIDHGLMQEDGFSRYARDMHAYGNAGDTYDGPCRFWVELHKGETTPQTAFTRALGVVNQYFLLTNSSEVNRILRAAR